MGFAIMSKDILYFFIYFHTVFMAGFFYDLDTTVRFDGTAQKFVRLKTYNQFVFTVPYIILNVMPKLSQMDPDLTEAALDLGCTPVQAFFKVVLHEIMPGIVSGALMAFTMSLDDFVISYFVTGSSFVTLPVEIYNYTKKPIQPKIYALFTLMFVVILVLMVVMNLLQARSEKRVQHGVQRRAH